MSDEPRVLLYIAAEDSSDPAVADWLERRAEDGYEVVRAVGHEDGRAALDSGTISVLALDLSLGRTPCLFLLREGRQKNSLESAYVLRDDSSLTKAGFTGVYGKDNLALLDLDSAPGVPELSAGGEESALLSRIAHEVRTPLHGIHGAMDLLEETGMSPMQKDYLQIVRDAADALMSVVDDVTDHVNPRRPQSDDVVFPFEPRTCLERVAAVMGPKASSKGLNFVHRTHFGVPWRVEGNPNALREILSDLAADVIRHTAHGTIVLEMDAPHASETRSTLRFRMSIEEADQEFGVSDDHDRHDQLEAGDDAALERCNELAVQLGGQLLSERTEFGTTRYEFAVSFKALPDRLPLANIGPDALDGRSVLIVDDSATNRAVYREQLANTGCDIIEATSGAEALEYIESRSHMGELIELAVIDFVMSGMDGAELAETIRALPNGNETRLVLCTSDPKGGDAAKMSAAGFDAYLTKPVRFDCLRKAMCLLLGSRDSERERIPLITQHVIAEMDRAAQSILYIGGRGAPEREVLMTLQRHDLPCDVAAIEDDAVGALAARRYGAIVVDCRASLDDGVAQAANIRATDGGQHVPLVAIVRQEDADCHATGIDEVLAEPVQPDELRSILCGFLGLEEPETFDEELIDWELEDSMAEPSGSNASPIDMDRLDEITAGDAELRQELVEMFLEDTEQRFASLETAIASEDGQQLNRTAHSIKGSCANMGAQTLQALALELESMGSEGRFDEAPELFANLKNEFEVVKVFFGSL